MTEQSPATATDASTALEPWHPPAPPHRGRWAAAGSWTMTLGAPVAATGIGWAAANSGTKHSVGDAIASLAGAAACAAGAIVLRKIARSDHRTADGQERSSHLLAAFGSIAATAVAGLATLFAVSAYTANPFFRIGYGLLGAAAGAGFRALGERVRVDQHLAHSQRLALETTAARTTTAVEKMRQDGETTRTVTREEQATVRTRLQEDGATTRTEITQQQKTVRRFLDTYAAVSTGTSRAAAGVASAAAPELPEHLRDLLALSGSAAEALGADSLALLGHAAAAAPEPEPGPEQPGLYL